MARHILLLALPLLVGCINDESVVQPTGGRRVPIRIASASVGATRAEDGILDGSFPVGTPITVAVDGRNYSYTTNAAGETMTCTSPESPCFPDDGSSVRVQAYYPASVFHTNSSQTFTVDSDQSSEAGYIASDLLYGRPQVGWERLDASGLVRPTTDAIPLCFEHAMAKVKVEVTTNGIGVSSILLQGIRRAVSFDSTVGCLDGEAITVTDGAGNAQTTVQIYAGSGTTPSVISCTALIPPQTMAEGTPFITVYAVDRTLTFTMPSDISFMQGSEYRFSLGVGQTVSDLQITLRDGTYTYNGKQQAPAIDSVTGKLADGTTITLNASDYTVSYGPNVNAGTAAGSVSIKCTGRYVGSATATFDIAKATPVITFEIASLSLAKNTSRANYATSSNGLVVTYTTSNTAVATVSNAIVKGVGYGTATITAAVPETANWNKASNTYTLTVRPVMLGEVTASQHYWLVCTNGWVYPSISDYNTYSGRGTLVAMIVYVSTTGHGGAIGLKDGARANQATAISNLSKLTAVNGPGGKGTWRLPNCDHMRQMFVYCGGYNNSFLGDPITGCTYGNLRTKLRAHSTSYDVHLGTSLGDYYVLNSNHGTGKYPNPGFGYSYSYTQYLVLNYDNSNVYYVRYYLVF